MPRPSLPRSAHHRVTVTSTDSSPPCRPAGPCSLRGSPRDIRLHRTGPESRLGHHPGPVCGLSCRISRATWFSARRRASLAVSTRRPSARRTSRTWDWASSTSARIRTARAASRASALDRMLPQPATRCEYRAGLSPPNARATLPFALAIPASRWASAWRTAVAALRSSRRAVASWAGVGAFMQDTMRRAVRHPVVCGVGQPTPCRADFPLISPRRHAHLVLLSLRPSPPRTLSASRSLKHDLLIKHPKQH